MDEGDRSIQFCNVCLHNLQLDTALGSFSSFFLSMNMCFHYVISRGGKRQLPIYFADRHPLFSIATVLLKCQWTAPGDASLPRKTLVCISCVCSEESLVHRV